MQNIPQITHKLNQDRIIQALPFFKRSTLLHADLLAQHCKACVARQNTCQGKRHECYSKQYRQQQQKTADQKLSHKNGEFECWIILMPRRSYRLTFGAYNSRETQLRKYWLKFPKFDLLGWRVDELAEVAGSILEDITVPLMLGVRCFNDGRVHSAKIV